MAAYSNCALRGVGRTRLLALAMLGADLTVVATLSVLTGLASPMSWTSDVLSTGLFLIPLIAAAQLDPYVSGFIAVPTLATYLIGSHATNIVRHANCSVLVVRG